MRFYYSNVCFYYRCLHEDRSLYEGHYMLTVFCGGKKKLPCSQLDPLETLRQKEKVHSESQRLGAQVFAVFSSVFSFQELDA